MGSLWDFLKTIFIPALISLSIYVALSYIILPLYRRHRQRYAQYLPLESISHHTSSIRSHISDFFVWLFFPSLWQSWRRPGGNQYDTGAGSGSLFDEEDGEGLVGIDVDAQTQERLARSADADPSDRRLSRDLEEGFQDESDDEEIQYERNSVRR